MAVFIWGLRVRRLGPYKRRSRRASRRPNASIQLRSEADARRLGEARGARVEVPGPAQRLERARQRAARFAGAGDVEPEPMIGRVQPGASEGRSLRARVVSAPLGADKNVVLETGQHGP